MFENKKLNILLAFLIAIGIWMYVVGEVNPTAQEKIKNIPIKITDNSALNERGLAVSSIGMEKIDITVKGNRSELNRLSVKNIQALVNVSESKIGENQINIDIRVPDGIEIISRSENKVAVNVENLKRKKVPVRVNYIGVREPNSEPRVRKIEHKNVYVEGAESLVYNVESASANISLSRLKEAENKIFVKLMPIDKHGNKVEKILVKPKRTSVAALLLSLKGVNLDIPVVDNSTDDSQRSIDSPGKIFIVGPAKKLKDIRSITAEPVDITNKSDREKIQVSINLPEGVGLSTKNSIIEVTVKNIAGENKVFTFDNESIKLSGESDQFDYGISDQVKISVMATGKREVLEAMKKEDITILADVSGLEAGVSAVTLIAKTSLHGVKVSITPATISVTTKLKNASNE